ncbi:GDP-mannose 4,6-dehydratase [Syntrophomonas palmitatica]|uniref:GDP-mannose 4,6-dehydratase n=1 Tax=Syntrophomonas palmitatica TaxID=402877 RepID=UPI00155DA281|nr:GDP-mannose 4,6-dehydratase [Syntrophomonas palmitatica]
MTGFSGPYLAEFLLKQGLEVWGTGLPSQEGNLSPGVILRHADINRIDQILDLLEECRPESIYHLAAQSSVGRSWQEPAETMRVNLEGSINLLEALRKINKACRVLLVGSGEEYGPVSQDELPINESRRPDPKNPYSLSKFFQSMIGLQYFNNYKMDIYLARAFNHTGPGQGRGFVVPDFASQIAAIEAEQQEPVIRVGNLAARRDFSDVRDVARAYWSIMEEGTPGVIYNVGSGRAIAIQEILDYLLYLSPVKIKVEIDPDKFRPVDVPVLYGDISRLRADTNWRPEIPLEKTLKDTLEYWRKK